MALQKVRYLLADCTREGARLWILLNSDRVAYQFWILTKAMATSFDVLPMESIDAPEEVKELVDLFMRQSRKARFEVSSRDRNAINEVMSVMDDLRCGVVPKKDNLGRILDYVGVRRWSECNNEVRFLESEIAFESSFGDDRKKKMGLLSSMMGLMCYCRCVCFNEVVDGRRPLSNPRSTHLSLINISPEDLRCPISLEFMVDPVVTSTGHTYERASILKWFRDGNPICPSTGERLASKDLIPNIVVQRLIERFFSKNDVHFPKPPSRRNPSTTIHGLVMKNSIKMVAKFLAEKLEGGGASNRAAFEIRVLAKTSIFSRSCLVEAGVIPHLIEILRFEEEGSAQENIIAAILSLSKNLAGKAIIVNNGGLRQIVNLLKNGVTVEAREHAAATLFYLSSVEEYSNLIGEISIPALTNMVRDGTPRGQRNALVAIFGLLVHKENHSRVLTTGAVPLLIQLSSDREDLATDSLAVLASLSKKPEGAMAILRAAGALSVVMEILRDSTSTTRTDYCVTLLLSLSINGGREAMCGLAKSSSLMESLYCSISEGTSRTSKKAGTLIRILHEFYERSSYGLESRLLLQEQQFVRPNVVTRHDPIF